MLPAPVSEFKKLAYKVMALIDQAKTSRCYLRVIVNLLNKLLTTPVDDEGKVVTLYQSMNTSHFFI